MLLRIKLQPCWKTQIFANSHTFYFVPILVDFKGWSLLRFFQHCTKPKLPCFARCRCLGDCTVCQQAWLPRSSCCAADNWSVLAFFRQKGEQEVLSYSGKYFFPFMFIYVHIIYIGMDQQLIFGDEYPHDTMNMETWFSTTMLNYQVVLDISTINIDKPQLSFLGGTTLYPCEIKCHVRVTSWFPIRVFFGLRLLKLVVNYFDSSRQVGSHTFGQCSKKQ